MVTKRGHVHRESLLEKIEVGMDRESVQRRFGSPSSTSRFGEETWYYMQARKEAHGFFRPEITQQQVIAVVFDAAGQVQQVVDYDLADSQQVVVVEDETPTEGHSVGFLEQALGNVGRFNGSGVDHSPNPAGPGRR